MKGLFLLLVDTFYPADITPEAKTNAFVASSLALRGWRVAIWGGQKAVQVHHAGNVEIVRNVQTWGLIELFRLAMWIGLHRPARIGIAYFVSGYSLKTHINWIPFIAKCFGIPCTTLFTNGNRPNRSIFQNVMLSGLGFSDHVNAPVGPLGGSDRLIFHSKANMLTLLGTERQARYSYVIVPPPFVLPRPPIAALFRQERTGRTPPKAQFVLGYFGLIYPSKGLEWLLNAVSLARKRGLSIKLIVIGGDTKTGDQAWNVACEDYRAMLEQLARNLKLQPHVIWCGYLGDVEASNLIADCHAVCLPFDDGVTGLRSSFVQCAMIGVPIITTLTDATDEYLRADDSGILFISPQNAEQIVQAISHLYADPHLRKTCRKRVRRFAARTYNCDAWGEAFDW